MTDQVPKQDAGEQKGSTATARGICAPRAWVVERAVSEASGLDYEELSARAGVGRRQVDRWFLEVFGATPGQLFRDARAAHAERLLRSGLDVLSASAAAGYSGPGRLHDAMQRRRNLTPGEVRTLGGGLVLRFAFFDTPVGIVLLGATEKGLCLLSLCGVVGAARAYEEMLGDFARALRIEDAPYLAPIAEELDDYLLAKRASFDPVIDPQGTDFQRRVWEQLRRIPPGERRSYRQVAQELGDANGARAVARACATNRLSLAIPCHRVVRGDGDLAGYRWGIGWKERLLEWESGCEGGLRPPDPPASQSELFPDSSS
jgi:AraC family transcriptional regulator of adaptative response/methylated-DNA-[protein]-cysteine methyltransferase